MADVRIPIGEKPSTEIYDDPSRYYTAIYAIFFQGLFRSRPKGDYRWSEDDLMSEIIITGETPVPNDVVEVRPAIAIVRGPMGFMDNSFDSKVREDPRTGAKERSDLVQGSMTINCIAKVGPEAQRIAWIVAENLKRYRVLLQRQKFHQIGTQISISGETPPGSLISPEPTSEMVMVTVSSPFIFRWRETITQTDAKVIEDVSAYVDAGLARLPSREREISTIPVPGGVSIKTGIPIDEYTIKTIVKP